MKKEMKRKDRLKTAALSALALLVLFLAGCGMARMTEEEVREKYVDTGIIDRTGYGMDDWLLLAKGEDWRRIVKNSRFQLGEEYTNPHTLVKSVDNGAYPSFTGRETMYPLLAEFARQHLDLSDVDIYGREDTDGSFRAGFVCSQYLPSRGRHLGSIGHGDNGMYFELDRYGKGNSSAETGDPLPDNGIKQVICYEALLFFTHQDNPVDSLTLEEVRKIFSGAITNWREVGGNDENIDIYQREEGSDTQGFMQEKIMKELEMLPPNEIYAPLVDGGRILSVYEYVNHPASIGYTLNIYYDRVYKNGDDEKMKDVKLLSIDGIAPTAENLRNGAYSATVGLYARLRNHHTVTNKSIDFLLWILSPEGQACVEQAGYTTLR